MMHHTKVFVREESFLDRTGIQYKVCVPDNNIVSVEAHLVNFLNLWYLEEKLTPTPFFVN